MRRMHAAENQEAQARSGRLPARQSRERARNIILAVELGNTQADVACRFGVSRQFVGQILKGCRPDLMGRRGADQSSEGLSQ